MNWSRNGIGITPEKIVWRAGWQWFHLKALRLAVVALLVPAISTILAARPAAWGNRQLGSFEFRSGVLVNSERGACYLMNTEAGIDAVDLRTGKLLWTTKRAQKPLLQIGTTLIAHAEFADRTDHLHIVFLNTAEGGTPISEVDIELPAGVRATIDDGPGHLFRVKVWEVADGVMVRWHYGEDGVYGAEDTSQVQHTAYSTQGAARIDVEAGEVFPADLDEEPKEFPPRLPKNLEKLIESGRLSYRVWRSGDVYAGAAGVEQDGVKRTVLKRWQATTGDSLPDVVLFTEQYTIRYPSADYRHLLVSRQNRAPSTVVSYDWLIFSLADGAQLTELQMELPAAWFFVTGPLLLHEVQKKGELVNGTWHGQPRRIRGINLQTGVEEWVWPLRDTEYRGSLPPGAPKTEDIHRSSIPSGTPDPAQGGQEP